jgi:crotonobetainyl-CoA:carnitine CoA-transferase CaiB-like acyl-CoA transferase
MSQSANPEVSGPLAGHLAGPLAGLKILDVATVLAGPLSSTLLSDLGAEVLKIEMPGKGDPLRTIPPLKPAPDGDQVPLWFKVSNRNKKGITLDLRKPRGRALFEQLLPRFDVLVENFRPGTLDGWGLPTARLHAVHPKLTILRVTGFGQTGPYRDNPGFARVFEALSGFTYLCGDEDRAPMHLGFPISDAVAGLFGSISILSAMHHRLKHPDSPGQEIDLSATEAIFRLLDFSAIEYDQLGIVRERSGNANQVAGPSSVYRTQDGHWATIAAAVPSIFERFAKLMGRSDLISDPRFDTNPRRVENREALNAIVSAWVASKTMDELARLLPEAEVPFSPVKSIDQVFADPQFQARGAIETVADPQLGTVKMQTVVPRFSQTPGAIRTSGPSLGQHNAEVYGGWLGLSEAEIAVLGKDGVI